MRSASSILRLVGYCVLASLCCTGMVQAYTTSCVANSSELNAALLNAMTASDTTVIELQQGTYNASATALNLNYESVPFPFNAIKLLGGYSSGCTSQTLNPTNTVFDGGNNQGYMTMAGSLTIEGITFQHFGGGGFVILMQDINSTTTILRNNVFLNSGAVVDYLCSDEGAVSIENNLVAGSSNDALTVKTDCLSFGTNTDHTTGLTPITITGNTVVNAPRNGIVVQTSVQAELYNNIAWGNGGQDIHLQTGDLDHDNTPGTATLIDNIYTTIQGTLTNLSSGSQNNDPQFIGGADYRLQNASPAVNSGDVNAPGITATDLDGNPRIIGSAPDIGAYETNVNDLASTTLIVTSPADSGAGTLRQAITDANATSGTHFIEFNINGSCPQVISLNSDLPYITLPNLTIDGFTQPGSKKNNYLNGDIAIRCIVLDGEGRNQSMGLTFFGASSGFYWVQGLAFENWGIALNMSAGQGNAVWGNQFGGTMWSSNIALGPNAIDIWLAGSNTTTSIGGTDPSTRNIIDSASGNVAVSPDPTYAGSGIAIPAIGGSHGNSIINNIIGLDGVESTNNYGNLVGIQVETAGNVIGYNVIGNNNNGIQVFGGGATGNSIYGNLIGMTQDLLCVLPPCSPPNPEANQAGLYFWQGANSNAVYSNTIVNNSIFGIEMIDGGTLQNLLTNNSIYANANEIDLNGYVYGYNDPNSTTPNRGLNYPLIGLAEGGNLTGTVAGVLESSNNTYTIEAYASSQCDAGGHGPGEFFLGSNTVSISNAIGGSNGSATFSMNLQAPPSHTLAGSQITLTATDSGGNTSQFSACSAYICDVIFRNEFDSSAAEKCP